MKTISLLLITICLSCFQNETQTKYVIEKVGRIRTELLNTKSLPPNIQRAKWGGSPPSDLYSFNYNTTRKENNIIDSVWMQIAVFTDSLEHLDFHEMHFKNDNENLSYHYNVNKHGVIDWAYRTDPPTSLPTMVVKNDKTLVTPSNQPIIEINTDSANYVPRFQPIKKPDEKTLAMYTARLKATLEELDKMLFAK